jgi:potassium channel subfamily K
MAPFLPAGAFLVHMFSPRDPRAEQGLAPDPEKGDSGDGQEHDYVDDPEDIEDLEDFEELHESVDGGEGAQNEHRPRQGVPLTSTATVSSSTTANFSRPSLPRWLVKVKEILFSSHGDHEGILPNYRRTPIISGSLIPFSILLEIPGLTEPWYVRTYGHQTVETLKNPPLLVISVSISLALAVLANIALIYRFLDRHVKRNTIICILALTLHGKPFFLCF